MVCATLALARLYLIQNKYAEAQQLLEDLADEVGSNIETILLDTYDLALGYFCACTGETQKIPRWISQGEMKVNSLLFQGLVFSYVVYGKTLILSEDWLKAESLCETFIPYFNVFQNQLGHIHNYVHLAIAAQKQGNKGKAKEHLGRALEIGQADHIVMPFVENGANLLPMLKNVHEKDGRDMVYVRHLIDLCTTYAPVLVGPSVRDSSLSPREIEVLKRWQRGLVVRKSRKSCFSLQAR